MKPKYKIVKEYIQSKIDDGSYQPSEKINSESEFMEQFGVSRHTVRMAIGDLVAEGWLYREQGAGTFCSEKSLEKLAGEDTPIKKIAIITTYISDYIFPSIIRGAENCLSEQGFNVSIFSTNNNHDTEKKVLEKIIEQQFDGVIIEPTKSAMSNPNIHYYLNLEHLNIPYVMIHAYFDELSSTSITMDDEFGGYMQTKYLIEQGHKQMVGFFKTDDRQGVNRMKGFLNAHRDFGIPVHPDAVITYDTDEKSTKPAKLLTKTLTNEHHDIKPTAIVCYNDELAMYLLEVLRMNHFSVPGDISMVSYDDSFLANVSEVKLTSIAHPKTKMGEAAAEKVVQLIHQQETNDQASEEVQSVIFEPEMVVRNSIKKLSTKRTTK